MDLYYINTDPVRNNYMKDALKKHNVNATRYTDSHRKLWHVLSKLTDKKEYLILTDDVEISDDFFVRLEVAKSNLPTGWDIVFLIPNVKDLERDQDEPVNDHVIRAKKANWKAYLINAKTLEKWKKKSISKIIKENNCYVFRDSFTDLQVLPFNMNSPRVLSWIFAKDNSAYAKPYFNIGKVEINTYFIMIILGSLPLRRIPLKYAFGILLAFFAPDMVMRNPYVFAWVAVGLLIHVL